MSTMPVSLPEDAFIGPYRVVRKLGQGGMGVVYEALHTGLGRRVAIKVLRGELAADKEVAARFAHEARTVNRVEHPGVVQVVDLGEQPGGQPYIVMEFLRGQTLAERLKAQGGSLSWEEVVGLLVQVAEVLVVAHRADVVHRDLKPENIMLIEDAQLSSGLRVKLLDFGIAKIIDEANANHFKTKTGALLGSPAYMSPEQCKGSERVTVQADVYALGVVLFECLAGGMPHVADGPGHMVVLHMFGTPRSLRDLRRGLPEPVYALVERLLQKAPEARPSMSEVTSELRRLQQSARSGLGPRTRLGVATVAIVAAAAVALSGLWRLKSGRFPWQPAPIQVASPVGSPPVSPTERLPQPSAVAPAASNSDARQAAKAAAPRPPAGTASRGQPSPPAGDLRFAPVDVVKRPTDAPLSIKPVR